MSADKSFLARWSRRKRDAAVKQRDPSPSAGAADGATASGNAAGSPAPSLIDPASLPSIESLGPGSDLRAFLAAGVPADLARAALRRAWSTDPMIRNFIGLSENAWDFNAPGGVPGFGSVTAEDVRRLLAQTMGESEATDATSPAAPTTSSGKAVTPVSESHVAAQGAAQERATDDDQRHSEQNDSARGNSAGNIAAQHKSQEREHGLTASRRRHGGALPE